MLAAALLSLTGACAEPTGQVTLPADPPQTASQPRAAESTQPGGSPSRTTAVDVPVFVFERRELPAVEGFVWLDAVAAGERGLVAVGGAAEEFLTDAAVWTSPDGSTWSRVEHDEDVFGDDPLGGSLEGNQYMADVVTGAFGVLAVGVDGRPGKYDAAAWLSADGAEWRRTRRGEGALGGAGNQIMRAVVRLGDAFVAVGESSDHAAVWISQDGLQWTAAAIRGAPGDTAETPSVVNDVAVGGPGLVAVGSTGLEPTPAVWVSTDGTNWDRLRDGIVAGGSGVEDADSVSGRMTLVAAAGEQLVAIAATADLPWPSFARPAMWSSVDGLEWRRVETHFEGTPPATMASIGAIAWDGRRLIAVGGYEATDPGWYPGVATLWVSGDGGAMWTVAVEVEAGAPWRPPPLDLPPGAVHLAPSGSQFVVIGNDVRPSGEEINGYPQYVDSGAIWIATMLEE